MLPVFISYFTLADLLPPSSCVYNHSSTYVCQAIAVQHIRGSSRLLKITVRVSTVGPFFHASCALDSSAVEVLQYWFANALRKSFAELEALSFVNSLFSSSLNERPVFLCFFLPLHPFENREITYVTH